MIVYTTRYRIDYLETLRNSTEGFERFKLDHLPTLKQTIIQVLGENADIDTIVQWVYKKVGIHHQLLKKLKHPEKYFKVIVENLIAEYIFSNVQDRENENYFFSLQNSNHQYFQELFDSIYQSENITHQQKLIIGLRMQGCSLIEIAESLEIHPRIIKRKMEKAFKALR